MRKFEIDQQIIDVRVKRRVVPLDVCTVGVYICNLYSLIHSSCHFIVLPKY